jgi:hypothetical protein
MHWRHAAADGFIGSNGTSATLTVLKVNHYGEEDEDLRFGINYWGGVATDINNYTVYDRTGEPLTYHPLEVHMDMKGSAYLETAGARMKKYELDRSATDNGRQMDNDIVLFRFADVLLMQAEAKIRNGESGQDELNWVRGRVFMNERPATLDNIYDERLIELAWEGWRRNDLIRFGKFTELYDHRVNAVVDNTGYTTVFPITGDVLSLNPNMVQNPGY